MADETFLERLKRRVSGKLMAIDGVSAVGVGLATINVYLAEDNEAVRSAVESVMQAEAPGTPLAYFTTGRFLAH